MESCGRVTSGNSCNGRRDRLSSPTMPTNTAMTITPMGLRLDQLRLSTVPAEVVRGPSLQLWMLPPGRRFEWPGNAHKWPDAPDRSAGTTSCGDGRPQGQVRPSPPQRQFRRRTPLSDLEIFHRGPKTSGVPQGAALESAARSKATYGQGS